jgi:hypothetical protein
MELCVVLGDRCVNIDSLIEEGIGLQTLSLLTLLRAESCAGLATTNELGFKKRRDFTPDELPIDF